MKSMKRAERRSMSRKAAIRKARNRACISACGKKCDYCYPRYERLPVGQREWESWGSMAA